MVLPKIPACYLFLTLITTLNMCDILDKRNFNYQKKKKAQNKITISLQLLQHLSLSLVLTS